MTSNAGFCPSCGTPRIPERSHCANCGNSFASPTQDPLIGQILGRKWKLTQQLGEGGMGLIYKSTHTETGKTAAIKLLRTQLHVDDRAVKRFYFEAQLLRRMQHPNIIRIYEFGFEETLSFYLAMEFLQGCSLEENIELFGLELPFEHICVLIAQVCDAMEHAHKQGIIHRDLKPDNIFLVNGPDSFEDVKLLDFGIAKLQKENITKLTQTGMLLGTPRYVSPEQVLNRALTPRTDIYSLSIILFELLTGADLFDAETAYEYLMLQVNGATPHLHQVRPEKRFPQGLDRLVQSGLSKDPDKRPSSMSDFKEQLLSIFAPQYPALIEHIDLKSEYANSLGDAFRNEQAIQHAATQVDENQPLSNTPSPKQIKRSQSFLAKALQKKAEHQRQTGNLPKYSTRKKPFEAAPWELWEEAYSRDNLTPPPTDTNPTDDSAEPLYHQTPHIQAHPAQRKRIGGALHTSFLRRQKHLHRLKQISFVLLFVGLSSLLYYLYESYEYRAILLKSHQLFETMMDREDLSVAEKRHATRNWRQISYLSLPQDFPSSKKTTSPSPNRTEQEHYKIALNSWKQFKFPPPSSRKIKKLTPKKKKRRRRRRKKW